MAVPIVGGYYTIRDSKGKESTFRMNFPTNADIAIAKEFLRNTGTMIDGLIRGQIVSVGITLGVENLPAGWKAAPLPNADVEEGARFSFRSAIGAITNFRIPTFDEANVIEGTQNVNTALAPVDAFVDRITDGYTQGLINVSPSDDHGSDIVSLESALESFTNTRN